MLRRLFALASGLSLLLCGATFALRLATIVHPLVWARTWDYYSTNQRLGGGPQFQTHRCVALQNGVLHVQFVQVRAPDPRWATKPSIPGYPLSYPFLDSFLGFSLYLDAPGWYTGDGSYREFSVPAWMLVGAFGLLPLQFIRRRRTRIAMEWLWCRSCNYNLTGNISGVCPECGTEIGRRRS